MITPATRAKESSTSLARRFLTLARSKNVKKVKTVHKTEQTVLLSKKKAWKCAACNHKFTIPIFTYPAPRNKNDKWISHRETDRTGHIEEVAECPFCNSNDIDPILTPRVI